MWFEENEGILDIYLSFWTVIVFSHALLAFDLHSWLSWMEKMTFSLQLKTSGV